MEEVSSIDGYEEGYDSSCLSEASGAFSSIRSSSISVRSSCFLDTPEGLQNSTKGTWKVLSEASCHLLRAHPLTPETCQAHDNVQCVQPAKTSRFIDSFKQSIQLVLFERNLKMVQRRLSMRCCYIPHRQCLWIRLIPGHSKTNWTEMEQMKRHQTREFTEIQSHVRDSVTLYQT